MEEETSPMVQDALPLEPQETRALRAGDESSPYLAFNLPDSDRENTPQVRALMDDPEIGGYLRGTGERAWTRESYIRAFAGFLLTTGLLTALFLFFPSNMVVRYNPPAPQDTPKPQPYASVAQVPILFREGVREINADLESGTRWQAAFEKLQTFIRDSDNGASDPPLDLRLWSHQEMLVMLASKEIPPGSFPDSYADEVYAGLLKLLTNHPGTELPFRAGAAYARLLASRPVPRDREGQEKRREETLAAIERLRAEHAETLDRNRELLVAEAENHIAMLPGDYRDGDRYLDYHWRRAAHAILRLYELYGTKDPGVRQIDRRRWQAAYRFFNYTLFTLDRSRLGRLASARLDGVDYTRDQVRAKLDELK